MPPFEPAGARITGHVLHGQLPSGAPWLAGKRQDRDGLIAAAFECGLLSALLAGPPRTLAQLQRELQATIGATPGYLDSMLQALERAGAVARDQRGAQNQGACYRWTGPLPVGFVPPGGRGAEVPGAPGLGDQHQHPAAASPAGYYAYASGAAVAPSGFMPAGYAGSGAWPYAMVPTWPAGGPVVTAYAGQPAGYPQFAQPQPFGSHMVTGYGHQQSQKPLTSATASGRAPGSGVSTGGVALPTRSSSPQRAAPSSPKSGVSMQTTMTGDSVASDDNEPCAAGKSTDEDEQQQQASSKDDSSTDASTDRIPCAFFLKTGTCAYGDRCKFDHPLDKMPLVRFNVFGLPLRPGEPDCAFYMKNLRCGFGPSCKFNHPDPYMPWGMPPSGMPPSGLQPAVVPYWSMPYMAQGYGGAAAAATQAAGVGGSPTSMGLTEASASTAAAAATARSKPIVLPPPQLATGTKDESMQSASRGGGARSSSDALDSTADSAGTSTLLRNGSASPSTTSGDSGSGTESMQQQRMAKAASSRGRRNSRGGAGRTRPNIAGPKDC